MKLETYERLIDGAIEAGLLTLWYAFFTAIAFCVLSVVFMIVYHSFPEISFVWWVVPWSFSIPIPVTIFVFYYRKAKKLYSISRFRDFWLGYSTCVDLPRNTDASKRDVTDWLKANIKHMYKEDPTVERRWFFSSNSDAVAFKLKWL